MLTPQEIQQANQATGNNVSTTGTPAVQSRADEIRALAASAQAATAKTQADATASARQSHLSDIPAQANAGVNQMKQGYADASNATDIPGKLAAGMKELSGAATWLTSPLAPLFKPVSTIIGDVANKVSDIPAVQKFATSDAGKKTAQVAEFTGNTANVVGTVAGAKGLVDAAPSIASSVADTTTSLASKVTGKVKSMGASTDESILASYNKAVKPTVAGKTGAGQLDTYNENVVTGVKAIVANKNTLSFETDAGTETGRTPQTRGELADAVSQTKQSIFKQYDSLTKQATGQGAKIPLENVGTALDEVINSEALKITNPTAVEYAKGMQQRLQNPDGTYKTIDPETAQDAITNWNASLKAFYKNPTYETASKAAIDAGVVNEVRGSLDKTINEATGADYQSLKSQYGALSSIEKDVNKSAIAQAKQTGTNTSGLGKYVDVFSGGDMVSGLLSLNPALFAKGAAQSGISHFFQWFNSPDRAVGSMFKGLTQTIQP